MGSRWWQTALACLLSALVAIGIYIKVKGTTPPPPEPAAKLVLSKDDVASWITFNNSFSDSFEKTKNTWSGVLFQLGTFKGPNFKFGSIELYKDGALVGEALKPMDHFYWINMVAEVPGKEDPMVPGEALSLFPSGLASPCVGADSCYRNRTLHAKHEVVSGLLTYWHGSAGFEVAGTPSKEAGYWPNTFEFSMWDSVRVEVRHLDTTVSPPVWVEDASYAAGQIDSIAVASTSKPPDMGSKLEPAWPFP